MSQASRTLAAGVFIVGLVLVGFGFMIFLLPRFFATLAAIVFCVTGIGCAITSIKMFIAQHKLDQMQQDDSVAYRRNVQVRTDENFDE